MLAGIGNLEQEKVKKGATALPGMHTGAACDWKKDVGLEPRTGR